MNAFEVPTSENGVSGVIVPPSPRLSASVKAAVDDAIASLPPDRHQMAEIAVDLETGVHFVYGYRGEHGWSAGAFVGRKWSGELAAGARVTRVW